jgi:hypothetical protein
MKKHIAILLITALTLALTGCSETDLAANPNADNLTTSTAPEVTTPDIPPVNTQPPVTTQPLPIRRPELKIPTSGCWICLYAEKVLRGCDITMHTYRGDAIGVLAHRIESVEKFIKIVDDCKEPFRVEIYGNLHDFNETGVQIFEGDIHDGMAIKWFYDNKLGGEIWLSSKIKIVEEIPVVIPTNNGDCWICLRIEAWGLNYDGIQHDPRIDVISSVPGRVEELIQIVESCDELFKVKVFKSFYDFIETGTQIFEGELTGTVIQLFYDGELKRTWG